MVVLALTTTMVATMVSAGADPGSGSVRIHVPRPTVTGPVTAGGGVIAIQTQIDQLPEYGYVQEEYFFEGTAQAFDAVGTPRFRRPLECGAVDDCPVQDPDDRPAPE